MEFRGLLDEKATRESLLVQRGSYCACKLGNGNRMEFNSINEMKKIIASIIMVIGYGIIAVPTGIVTAGLIKAKKDINTQSCINCSKEGHDNDAEFCKYCGSKIHV